MSECSRPRLPRKVVEKVMLESIALPVMLVAIILGCRHWRDSQTLQLPLAADIARVDFGINSGFETLEWHNLPLQAGNVLVDFFRDSAFMPPRQDNAGIIYDTDKAKPEYSVRITDKGGKEFTFSFHVYSNQFYPEGCGARSGRYVFPESRLILLKAYVQYLFTTQWIAGGQYSYLPGEDDHRHHSRVSALISNRGE